MKSSSFALTRGSSYERDEKAREGGGGGGRKIDTSAPRRGTVNARKTISPIKIAITYFRDR